MFRRISLACLTLAATPLFVSAQNTIQTVVGGGPNNLPATAASLNSPSAVAVDGSGNVYVAVENDSRVYKIDTTGTLTVLAGNGAYGYSGDGGPATAAELESPEGLAVDASGNVYISDSGSNSIREVLVSSGNIQTIAGGNAASAYGGDGGPAVNAQLSNPIGIALDASGNLYIADAGNYVIREINASTGNISTIAGNNTLGAGYAGDGGPATSAQLTAPFGVAVDGNGNVYIADRGAAVVREVTASTGVISTVAGNGTIGYSGDGGPATSAQLAAPFDVTVDAAGNVYITDFNNSVVREILASNGFIQTVAGSGTYGFSGIGGPATSAQMAWPFGIAVDGNGNLYVADLANYVVWEVLASNGNMPIFAGNLIAGNPLPAYSGDGFLSVDAEINQPLGFNLDASGNLLIADSYNDAVRVVSGQNGTIQTVVGNGTYGYSGDGGPAGNAQLAYPTSVISDAAGDLFIADQDNQAIRVVVAASGNIQTIAGNGTAGYSGDGGPASSAMLSYPQDLKLDASGNIFFTDSGNNAIREILVSNGNIQTIAGGNATGAFAGDGGPATSAQLYNPNGLFIDGSGNIFFADSQNNVVREILASNGNIQTVAGTGGTYGYSGDGGPATSALLDFPSAVFVDASGNIFICDSYNAVVREVVASTGNIQTVAGTDTFDFSGDGGPALAASLYYPFYIAPAPGGSYFIGETSRIRQVTPNATPAPGAQLSATSLTFNTNPGVASAAQTVTVTNNGTAALAVTGISITGTNSADFSQTNNCSSSVAASATCTISVIYNPAAAGSSSASVSISDNAGTGSQSVALSGSAANSSAPSAQLSTPALTFAANVGVSSSAQTVTLTNSGNAALTITGIAINGASATSFTQTNNCGSSLVASASCTVSVTFKPSAGGASSASVTFTDNAGSGSQSVSLSGNAADFSLTVANNSASATVQPGATATYSLTLSAGNGYAGAVSFTCSGAPTAATCSVSPSTYTFSNSNTGTTLTATVTTTAPSSAAVPFAFRAPQAPFNPNTTMPLAATVFLALALLGLLTQRNPRTQKLWVSTAAVLFCLSLLSGCSGGSGSKNNNGGGTGNPGTPVGAYTIIVTATPQQGTSHSTTLTLNVQ